MNGTKFCSQCGTACSDAVKFCTKCGNPFPENESLNAPTVPTPPTQPAPEVDQNQAFNTASYPSPLQNSEPQYSMKWFKFLIYFALFAGAVINLVNGINYITGGVYAAQSDMVVTADTVYSFYGQGLKVLDMIYGILLVGFAGWQIYTRFQLSGYKSKAPMYICLVYGLGVTISLLYMIVASIICGKNLFDSSAIISIGVNAGLLIGNYIYFKKRKGLFVN